MNVIFLSSFGCLFLFSSTIFIDSLITSVWLALCFDPHRVPRLRLLWNFVFTGGNLISADKNDLDGFSPFAREV